MIIKKLKQVRHLINSGKVEAYLPTDLGMYRIKGVSTDWKISCYRKDPYYSTTFYGIPDENVIISKKRK
jgi:hypothetical protein